MTILGEWNLYFDWEGKGVYYPTSICFNRNGTFSRKAGTASNSYGKWVQIDSVLMWQFAISSGLEGYFATTYSGSKVGSAMIGVMIHGNPTRIYKGRWYAIRKGKKIHSQEDGKPKFDVTGKEP